MGMVYKDFSGSQVDKIVDVWLGLYLSLSFHFFLLYVRQNPGGDQGSVLSHTLYFNSIEEKGWVLDRRVSAREKYIFSWFSLVILHWVAHLLIILRPWFNSRTERVFNNRIDGCVISKKFNLRLNFAFQIVDILSIYQEQKRTWNRVLRDVTPESKGTQLEHQPMRTTLCLLFQR